MYLLSWGVQVTKTYCRPWCVLGVFEIIGQKHFFFYYQNYRQNLQKGVDLKKEIIFFNLCGCKETLNFIFNQKYNQFTLTYTRNCANMMNTFCSRDFFPITFIVKTLFGFDRFWSLFFSYLSNLKLYFSKTI